MLVSPLGVVADRVFRCRREGNVVRSPGIRCDGREMVKVRDASGDLHAGSNSRQGAGELRTRDTA